MAHRLREVEVCVRPFVASRTRYSQPDHKFFSWLRLLKATGCGWNGARSKALVFGTYEREVISVLLRVVKPGWTVFDAGAHIGYFTLLLAKLVGPRGRVVAFEPFPENFRALEENVRLNDQRNIVLEECAVAATSGTASLRSNDANRLTYTASLVQGRPISEVKVVSLDDYARGRQERIHFIMMDVEGAEADVLKGMQSILRRDLPTLLIELHGFDSSAQLHPALQELRAMNYCFQFLGAPGVQAHILAGPEAIESHVKGDSD